MKISYQGWIRNQANWRAVQVHMKLLGQGQAAQIIKLQALVVEKLDNKALYYPLTLEEITASLTPELGFVLGAFVEEDLIGFRMVTFPKAQHDNLGLDVNLPLAELNKVAHLEAVCIHPDYRGNSLQRIMTKLVLEQLVYTGVSRHICLTISPKNLPSIKNTLANQLYVTKLSYKYNQTLRYIFYRDLEQPINLAYEHSLALAYTEFENQQRALAKGYVGYGLEERASGLYLLLAKRSG